ncbi:MAG: carboxypeptidase-like regulatory domain-containing protein [Candidatus Zixiibacteriota bacterium]
MSVFERIGLALVIPAVICCFGGMAGATDLTGVIHDSATGQPVPGATVIVLETSDTTQTDGSGTYFFSSLPSGSYTLLVGHSGYSPQVRPSVGACCGQYTGGYTGNTDCDTGGRYTLNDVTVLIDNVFLTHNDLCCPENGNVDGSIDGKLTLNDITKLIDNVFITHAAAAPCQ